MLPDILSVTRASGVISRRLLTDLACLAALLAAGAVHAESEPAPEAPHALGAATGAVLLEVADAIGPATSDYVQHGIRQATERGSQLVILKLDTPGGLDSAMREIIRDIIAAPMPVVTWVAPSGARAASAGTYILYASHVAAMAPATNLGAATPVQIGGLPTLPDPGEREPAGKKRDADDEKPRPAASDDAMTKKLVNDAVAYIRGLARMRGRNAEWAELAVREAASLSAEAALEQNVIDLIAGNERVLLDRLNGRTLEVQGVEITLDTTQTIIERIEPDWRMRLLAVIASPNVAYILMLIGIYGIFFELANPGGIVPGVIGAIALLTAMFALQMLPVNYAGLALIGLGMAFMVAELFVPSFGALGIGGVVAFAIGSVILFDTESQQFRVSLPIVVALTLLTAGFFFIAVRALVVARRGPVVSGREELVGSRGRALEDFESNGQIRVHGEIWNARSSRPVRAGEEVRVTRVEGLTLHIERSEENRP